MSEHFDTIILGAGGAGLMAAATAGQRGARVLLLDHADAPGKKILISGGGRCNFTNLNPRAECYLSQNPHFAKSAMSRYTQHDFIALVERHGIAWHEKTLGQLFCDGSARQIVAMLLAECESGGVDMRLSMPIEEVACEESGFRVSSGGKQFRAGSLVVATGGPSIPKMGATGFAYDVARQFGLKVVEPRPALVPLTLGREEALFRDLSGVAAPVVVRCDKTTFREAALFTHKGLSGPAILQISSYWKPGQAISIDFVPELGADFLAVLKKSNPAQLARKALIGLLPERLVEALCVRTGLDGRLGDLKDGFLSSVSQRLHDWTFQPNGTEGFAKAEVTIGGVSTAELSSRTMEAKSVPGLFFIGEGVDVTGWLGGYNFQWAWASGVAAGEAVAERKAS
ncbi:NAD(P)/FAD-dependent oxidoreductase [Pseudahrensia aquimaris]|uniref:NAD(P)/FAD-dependent oxidoreductase n=1 Tax=Pseudahrensia aquimaris TaxID=744461 RepID=A0ABW3FHP2_9HYPH